jgi:DNA-directed RNA polymerase sigma subunit (sigma70/sigma32)
MDDKLNTNRLFPDMGDLYTGEEDVDIDKRYRREDTIEGCGSDRGGRTVEVLNYLSAELNAEKYQIRTPEQQAKWTEMKANNTRTIGKYLLRLRCVVEDLLTMCRDKAPEKLFGEFKEKDGQTIIYNHEDYCFIVQGLLEDYLEGQSQYGIVELADIIVDDYNLSYAVFTRKACLALLSEFAAAKEEYQSATSSLKEGQTLSLLHDYGECGVLPAVREMESKSGLDWATLSTLMRSVKILYTSSEQLKERLVSTNLRSCLSSAMNHYHAVGGAKNVNFDEKDLITEASLGLMHAADMYVHGTSARFTTYAEYWIRLKVTRYTKDNNTVRVPVHVTDLVYTIMKELREHARNGGDDAPLSKSDVEKRIKRKISKSVWQVALNRYHGRSLSISCVTNEGDTESMAFDAFTENRESAEDTFVSRDAKRIMDVAKSLVRDGVTSKDKKYITPEQYLFLKMSFIDDLKNPEIAQVYGAQPSAKAHDGKSIDSKYVRTEIARAIERIKRDMGV